MVVGDGGMVVVGVTGTVVGGGLEVGREIVGVSGVPAPVAGVAGDPQLTAGRAKTSIAAMDLINLLI